MTVPTTPKLSVRNLWKIYGPNPRRMVSGEFQAMTHSERLKFLRDKEHFVAAADVSFDVYEGETFVIMGLSGSGKSTVMRAIARLDEPTSGEIFLDDIDLMKASKKELTEIRRRKMGMVFQNFGLMPHLDVVQNVAFPLKAQGQPRERRTAHARKMTELVGLAGKEKSYPHQLSGGQQQRVGIARSLAAEPELWFLDEPFSALDPLIRAQMQDEFLRLQKQLLKTIVFVTHDFLEALKLADNICIMKDGEIVQIGTPAEIVLHPANDYVREFIGDVPLANVLYTGDLMSPAWKDDEVHPTVASDVILTDAIKLFDETTETVDVIDKDGNILGSLHPLNIIRSLYHDEVLPTP
ncbi:proline/glycine betaine ABC transporter ATP-binding protein [Octadecabacter arcticus 238]|jgi:glycine betaine/proline transport system ATP-binding protein|uniref:Quaternary amine transport ATP-binding protein n=1 Tax=Octadecabacter arcticus 238 TaxID=391616 RepID=M9RWW8_9RHOB|nr:betaine/proline/choline family ABC transporter ATP-binding protein [Octadecabacter arcticus]AGI74375.1 proline/glycine betaine ABC transporter ATP-binding protein [Octadecabacter arcticus 238]